MWEGVDNVDIFFGQHIVFYYRSILTATVTVQDTRSFDRAVLTY